MHRHTAFGVCLQLILSGGIAGAAELVENGEFDQNVVGWGTNSVLVQVDWDPLDADSEFESGSARVISTETRLRTAVGLSQCVVLPPAPSFNFSGAIFVPSAQTETATVGYTFDWQADACAGRVGLELVGNAVGADTWEIVEKTTVPPEGAGSVFILGRITFATKNDPDGAFAAHFDAIRLPEPRSAGAGIAAFGALVCLARSRFGLRGLGRLVSRRLPPPPDGSQFMKRSRVAAEPIR